ncbi:MAG TPA: HAD hydrolase family protein [Opitutaceae bacterium]|nr:HAD hydrolase family protein [Opitutaceae bacterium]
MPRPQSAVRNRRPAIPAKDWAAIRLFATDVDGALTDGCIFISSDGTEAKNFHVLDGMGMSRLLRAGVAVAWISGRLSGATAVRAAELKIPHLVQGRTDKLAALQELAGQLGVAAREICYFGDDDIDAGAIGWAGIGAAPRSAMPAARKIARYVPVRPAGHGAVREICEHILAARGHSPLP